MLEADVLASLFDEKQAAERRIPVDPHKELRYLVIDDQEASRQTLKICIQSMGGFSVDQAQTFNEAYHRIRGQMPDVIVCDYILGPGRTGQQMLEDLRRADALPDTVAFLMVTAERSYEQVVSAVELAPDDYIIKPFTPEALRTRLDRVIRKKIFFRHFFGLKRTGDYDAALAELDMLAAAADGKPYRFDILRARAETLLRAGRAQEALDSFTAIIDIHPFPWAKAGQARALQRLNRYDEANEAVDNVLAAAPNYFDAYDLKADICCDLGEFDKAQAILQQVAERTPRNWRRKRTLSNVAKLNGDYERARRLIEEVIANDRIAPVPARDRIELARTALAGEDKELALATLNELTAAERETLSPAERLDAECLEAMTIGGEAGEKKFERLRAELSRSELPAEGVLDTIRAALQFSDRQLADQLAEKLLTGHEAKRAFHTILEVFREHDMEDHFRKLQRAIATRRMAHRA
jgi:DNA-binding response OmpR family regulator